MLNMEKEELNLKKPLLQRNVEFVRSAYTFYEGIESHAFGNLSIQGTVHENICLRVVFVVTEDVNT